jgi:glycosyltransferase involved in cell wall biosynthesis
MSKETPRAANILLSCVLGDSVGGVQVVFRDLVHWLESNSRQVFLVYPSALSQFRLAERPNSWGRPSFYCPMPGFVGNSPLLSLLVFALYFPISTFHLVRLIRRKRVDAINCHFLAPYLIHLVVAARLVGVPVILSLHGAEVDYYTADADWWHRILFRAIVRSARRIVTCSAALARQTEEAFPDAADKVTFVHNGVDLSSFVNSGSGSPLPESFVLCVARHVSKKGLDVLLRAFVDVVRDFPQISLVFVGSGPLLEEHKALAAQLGIERQVAFKGDVPHDEIAIFFERCKLFVLPSRAEPFGIVLLEAAYYRKGIVCTRVGGIPEIIDDGVSGLIVDPDCPSCIAASVLRLLHNPDLASRFGLEAYHTLMARFLWRDRVHDYISIFEAVA